MIKNYIHGEFVDPDGSEAIPVYNPATGEILDYLGLSSEQQVHLAITNARDAFMSWSKTPILKRVELMFKVKEILERDFEKLASTITVCHGKTLEEARGELRRGIEVVDFALSATTNMQGRSLRNVSSAVDQEFHRFPVGIVAGIPPFNFPIMIPLWMIPLALVTGNTFVLKPSDKTPLGAVELVKVFEEAGTPPGVLNVVHGQENTVNSLISHPDVSAVSFVGSEEVAKRVYRLGTSHLKRVQALGGAKNHLVVMSDADPETSANAIINSAFGNAGERCLAGSVILSVGSAASNVLDSVLEKASKLKVGDGMDSSVDMGPVIRKEHRDKLVNLINQAELTGGKIELDGRNFIDQPGFFLGPTIINELSPDSSLYSQELFGPVISCDTAEDLDSAIERINRHHLGNMSVIFTQSGRHARTFRENVEAGMVGINVAVAQPFAFFPFSGWKGSFFGDLHANGQDGFQFYTRTKMVVSRW